MAQRDCEHKVQYETREAKWAVIERQKEAAYAAMLRRDLERASVILP